MEATPLAALLTKHLEYLEATNYSAYTVRARRIHLNAFVAWCEEHGIEEPAEVTRPVLERYQRYLFHYRKKNGQPLSFRSQHNRLVPLRVWFKWMARNNYCCTTRLPSWSCRGSITGCRRLC